MSYGSFSILYEERNDANGNLREYLVFREFILERNIVISLPCTVTRSPMLQENLHIMQACRLFPLLSQHAIYFCARARSFKPLNLLNICAYRMNKTSVTRRTPSSRDMRVNWKQTYKNRFFPRYAHLKEVYIRFGYSCESAREQSEMQ